MTSPPFALRRQKAYGNVAASEYVEWFWPFGREEPHGCADRQERHDRPKLVILGGAVDLRLDIRLPRTVDVQDETRHVLALGVLLALTFFCCCAAHSGPIFHMVSYATLCGVSPMAAVSSVIEAM